MAKEIKSNVSNKKEEEDLFFGRRNLRKKIIMGILTVKEIQEFIELIKRN